MLTYILCKASALYRDKPVDSAELKFIEELPECANLGAQEKFYKDQAQTIRDVLFNHVAQGVRSQLLILMLQDAADLYRGNHE